ncbi:hypothetical protein JAAARDRAFT_142945, partial [Jaapia argillacea MUCL 33604]
LLLWITDTLTPQEIRDKLMDNDNSFQKAMIDYLESSHIDNFMDATMNEVASDVKLKQGHLNHNEKPRTINKENELNHCFDCLQCTNTQNWMATFQNIVNNLVYHLNRHTCQIRQCKEVKSDVMCKARFSRELHENTSVDKETGYINMKKLEPYINFFTPVVTFLLRCNSDVTCLLSGTTMKAVIAYVTDYVTKSSLKTHVMFDVVRNIVERKSDFLNGTVDSIERGRHLLTKITNAFTVKMEIGAPMAALFLMGKDDHYTNCKFKTFY